MREAAIGAWYQTEVFTDTCTITMSLTCGMMSLRIKCPGFLLSLTMLYQGDNVVVMEQDKTAGNKHFFSWEGVFV